MAEEQEQYAKSYPIKSGNYYENPWSTWGKLPGFSALLKWQLRTRKEVDSEANISEALEILEPKFKPNPTQGVLATWLGHATVLIQMEGKAFLTDPIFSHRCSPVPFSGPKRFRPPPCTVADLPEIDVVLISHNHYDHLDSSAVSQLNKKFGDKLRWYVPMGLKRWFEQCHCTNVVEKSWWEEDVLENTGIKVVSLPAQHWSLRTGMDRNKSLWCGWCVKGQRESFFFAGDTGYCSEFKTIGHHYGPFTMAAIPIGCYEPRWFMQNQHINPEDAVKIHVDIRATHSLGIHWGTYDMGSTEPLSEPKRKLAEEVLKANLSANDFFTLRQGESWTSPDAGFAE